MNPGHLCVFYYGTLFGNAARDEDEDEEEGALGNAGSWKRWSRTPDHQEGREYGGVHF